MDHQYAYYRFTGTEDAMKKIIITFAGPQTKSIDKSKIKKIILKIPSLSGVNFETLDTIGSEPSRYYVSDEYVMNNLLPIYDHDMSIIITKKEIEDSYFIRQIGYDYTSDSTGQWNGKSFIISTYEMNEICHAAGDDINHVVAMCIYKCHIVQDYLKSGGKYFDLYTENTENSWFNFCEDKSELTDSYNSRAIGPRAEHVLSSRGFSREKINVAKKEIQKLYPSFFSAAYNKIKGNAILNNTIFYVLGLITSVIIGMK